MDDELVGINKIAVLAKVSKQAVANWRSRFTDLPMPIADLASDPVFRRSHVHAWLRKRKSLAKWKTSERIIGRIVEIAIARAQKGNAFRSDT